MWNPQGKIKRGRPKSHGDVTSRQTSSKQGMAGNNWRVLPKTGGAGGMLWMAYAPGGVKDLSKHNTKYFVIQYVCSLVSSRVYGCNVVGVSGVPQ